MPSSEANMPALDESWASLTDIESLSGDDLRSEHTDVGSLLDVYNLEDVYSIVDEFSPSHGRHTSVEDTRDNSSDLRRTKILRMQGEAANDVRSRSGQVDDDTQEIGTFPPQCYTKVNSLSKEQGQAMRQRFPRTDDLTTYSSIIHMALMEHGLDLDTLGYFKIVLLGKQVEQFRPELQRKLGDALAARPVTTYSPRSSISRFHLVPNSFGPGSKPDYADLVAIDKQIDFECFDSVEELSSPRPAFVLKDRQSKSEVASQWDGYRYVATNPRWTLPDLAIICVDLERGFLDSQSLAFLRFAAQHEIPSITIRMDRSWHGVYNLRTWDSTHLYETVEARTEHLQSVDRLDPLPVHMGQFLNLDSATLNKHIAFITSKPDEDLPRSFVDAVNQEASVTEKPKDGRGQLLRSNTFLNKNLLMALWLLGAYLLLGARLWPIMYETISGASGDGVQEIVHSHAVPSMMPTWTSATPVSETPGHVPVAQVTPSDTSRAIQLGQPNLAVASIYQLGEDALHFQVGLANDNQFMVKLPKIATSRKKRSPLSVVLERNNDTVPAVVHELLEGVYSIQLQPHDAFGDIEVNLTMTKPSLSETLTVSFGDRPTLVQLSAKKVIEMAEKQIHAMITTLSNIMPARRQNLIIKAVNGTRSKLGEAMHYKLDDLAPLKAHVLQSARAAREDFLEMSDRGALQGKKTLGRLSNGISEAGKALSRWFDSMDLTRLQHDLSAKAMLVEKLAVAQERARQIVSKGETRVKSKRHSRRHGRRHGKV
ncbi:hypothetical protein EDD36DRAFT_443304 [Exophiala viscosa]|uniref:Uncharacterized protein n=1 Tax=Exophiala viscosa TaxID=2486360 RepID=A0AAN6DR65_9EURO|nr:hypothetical protein EDD36DRAFT_443304 [Exophiala viscosa]